MYFWQAFCAAFVFGSLGLMLPPVILMAPVPARCGSGKSRPCSRMHFENFSAPSKALSCPPAPFLPAPSLSELPHAPTAKAAATAARMSGDLVMAPHEAGPT